MCESLKVPAFVKCAPFLCASGEQGDQHLAGSGEAAATTTASAAARLGKEYDAAWCCRTQCNAESLASTPANAVE